MLGFGPASGHGNALKTRGWGRAAHGEGDVWWANAGLLYTLQGEREVPFQGATAFNGNLVSGPNADFIGFVLGGQNRAARMCKMADCCSFCKGNRGGISGMLRFLEENGVGPKHVENSSKYCYFYCGPFPPASPYPALSLSLSLSLSLKGT